MNVVICLPASLSGRFEASERPVGVSVLFEGEGAWIEADGHRRPVWVLERASRLPSHLSRAVPDGWTGLIVGRGIPADERDELERSQLSWWDLEGGLHLDLEGRRIDRESTPPRTRGSSATGRSSERGLGPVGRRAAQLLLTEPTPSVWSVTRLAERARISAGQAHNVLALLERDGVLEAVGRGASKRRVLSRKDPLLGRLRISESLLRPPSGLFAHLYSHNDREVTQKLATAAASAGVDYAVTSTMGSRLWGVPVTTTDIVRVRVAADDLLRVAFLLDIEDLPSRDGANLELWTDTGLVGTAASVDIEGVRVAPAARVWLDLLRQGGRYADAADLLWEQLRD